MGSSGGGVVGDGGEWWWWGDLRWSFWKPGLMVVVVVWFGLWIWEGQVPTTLRVKSGLKLTLLVLGLGCLCFLLAF